MLIDFTFCVKMFQNNSVIFLYTIYWVQLYGEHFQNITLFFRKSFPFRENNNMKQCVTVACKGLGTPTKNVCECDLMIFKWHEVTY